LADLLRFDERIALGQASRIVVIFSPTQLVRDEGQRPTNLALALARRGTPVVFVAWTWGEDEAVAQECAGDETLVLPVDVALRNVTRLLESFDGRERIVVFGFPHPEFSHVLAAANSVGWITVYDAVDDWRAFGHVGQAPWYRETAEQEMTAGVDLVVSVNDRLADRLRAIGRDSVLVLPNGLVEGIDCVDNPLPLKRGAITAGYWGHLTTAWFDWDLVVAAALKEPSWLFYLVGYGDNVRARILPPNVKYLGMQKQNALASIGANLDVGIVPFRRGPVADGADVIKIYEYLAMGLPVVVTGVHPPEGASDHVLRASGVDEFRSMIRQAAAMRHERVEERRAYAQARTWGKRLDTLLEAIDRGDQRIGQKRWLFQESK
jgi:glycosyltransferase involved in cell wall biosynthesis